MEFDFVAREAKDAAHHARLLLEYAPESLVIVKNWPRRRFDWSGHTNRTFVMVIAPDGCWVKDYDILGRYYVRALMLAAHRMLDRADVAYHERAEAIRWLLKKANGKTSLRECLWHVDYALGELEREDSPVLELLTVCDYQELGSRMPKGEIYD